MPSIDRHGRRAGPVLGGHPAPAEKDESEVRWLISYSDFMMQLVCLFILLYSVSSLDAAKAGQIVESWREQIGLEPLRAETHVPEASHPPVSQARIAPTVQEIELAAGRLAEGVHVRVHPTSDGFRLSILESMFEENAGAPNAAGERALDLAARLLETVRDRVDSFEIVGHAAAGEAEPLRLSLTRSREAFLRLTRSGAPYHAEAKRLAASGRGAVEPVADPRDPRQRGVNRRVEFLVRLVR